MADRGQSEVVGYILVFSVVVLTVALVTVAGQAGLAETRDTQQTANVEEGFAVLAENVDDVVRDGVSGRSTELSLSGGELSLGSPVAVSVRAEYSDGSVAFDRSDSYRPVVYRPDSGTELAYANGAVIARGEGGGVAMLRRPRLLLSAERAVIPMVNTTLDRRQFRGRKESVDSESRVLVRAERRGKRPLTATDGQVDLTVEITSPRATAWREYFEAEVGADCTQTGDTVTCRYSSGEATVVLVRVAISFD
jgi:hypothetical protein